MVEKGTQRGHGKPGAMFGLRSVQGRATAAILVLLVLLGSVAAAAAWRAQEERTMRDSLAHRSAVVAAVDKARAEFLRSATLVTAAISAEDATPFVDSYRQAIAERDDHLFQARVELTALGDTDALAALDSCIEQMGQTKTRVDAIVNFAATADVSTRTDVGQEQYAPLWAETQAELADLDELANEQEAQAAAARAAEDSSAEATLVLILRLSALAFLGGAATLGGLYMSVVRPLAALRTSARAVAAGDLETRARVAGPEEVASLAQDFNEMVVKRGQAEEALRRQSHELANRAKELNCLYEISNLVQRPDISLEEMLQGTVNLVPPSWQYPEIACARIVLGGQEYLTERFRETAWRQISDIIVNGERTGAVEVCYLEEKPESAEGPFLAEERGLINAIAERLGQVSERKQAEEALYRMSRRDPLTGVLNHGAIVNGIGSLISTGEHGIRCAVAMIDVDRLKVTNDAHGHQVGDAVLVAVAAALSSDNALVGRYGGDEFVAILPGADRKAAERYRKNATKALALVTITDPQTGATVRAGASFGLAIFPEDGSTFADLLRVSDSAMYAAKRQRHDRRRSPRKHAPPKKAA